MKLELFVRFLGDSEERFVGGCVVSPPAWDPVPPGSALPVSSPPTCCLRPTPFQSQLQGQALGAEGHPSWSLPSGSTHTDSLRRWPSGGSVPPAFCREQWCSECAPMTSRIRITWIPVRAGNQEVRGWSPASCVLTSPSCEPPLLKD